MPLSFNFMRIKAQTYAALAADYAGEIVYRGGGKGKFRVLVQKVRYNVLVFRRVKGAGGVNYPAARRRKARRLSYYVRASLRALGAVFLAPFFHGYFAPPEHTLSGAGDVRYHRVEKFSPFVRKSFGRFAGHNAAFYAAALHILRQNFGSGGDNFIAHQQFGIKARRVGALSAGCGAQIKHAFARLYVRRLHYGHGGRLLDIVCSRFVQNGLSRSARIISARGAPRHLFRAAVGDKRGFKRVYAQRKRRRFFVLRYKQVVFFAQKGAHSPFERLR